MAAFADVDLPIALHALKTSPYFLPHSTRILWPSIGEEPKSAVFPKRSEPLGPGILRNGFLYHAMNFDKT